MKHLLAIRLSAMGDVAMTAPVIKCVVDQHPDVRITVVSRAFFKPFFNDMERVDFFAVDVDGRHKGLGGLIQLFRDLKALQVDGVADLHNVLRSIIVRNLFRLSGYPVAFLDKARAEKKALTRAENKVFQPLKSTHKRYAEVFEKLGFKIDLTQHQPISKKPIPQEVIYLFSPENKVIGIAPFAQYQTKVYPLDLMQKVIDTLREKPNYQLILFGGKNELEALHQLQNGYENVTVLVGKVNFVEELSIIQHLNVMLSMDSGNAHIAAMYGVPTVVLFGATHPYAGFMPFNQPLENALTPDLMQYPKLPTSVYGNKIVEGYQDVMRTILPEEVVKAVESKL